MGLLKKTVSIGFPDGSSGKIKAALEKFRNTYPLFHCIVLNFNGNPTGNPADIQLNFQEKFSGINEMIAGCGAECIYLPEGCLVLLPGGLDMDLFSRRLSKSSGSTLLAKCSVDSALPDFEALEPFIS
jgi:hypothetical protein